MKKFKFILPVMIAIGIAIMHPTSECDCKKSRAGIPGIVCYNNRYSHKKTCEDDEISRYAQLQGATLPLLFTNPEHKHLEKKFQYLSDGKKIIFHCNRAFVK
ncbi:MAG: hypothetical protein N2316_09140 [Spirochaetes bacterium]|nr:hypothetical protein [Spirochaetota bacterium]